jgi:hypothetical protein
MWPRRRRGDLHHLAVTEPWRRPAIFSLVASRCAFFRDFSTGLA